MKNILIICILVLLFSNKASGQDFNTIIKEVIAHNNKDTYHYNLHYKVFRGEKGQKVYEDYKGVMALKEGNFYQKIDVMETLQTSTFIVKLNHNDKQIRIDRGDALTPVNTLSLDLSTIDKLFDKGTVEDLGSVYKLELLSKKTSGSQYSKVFVHIDKQTKKMIKQVMFLRQLQDFSSSNTFPSNDQYDIARLEISIIDINDDIARKDELFKQERYFTIVNNKIKLGNEFKNFELVPTY